MVRVILLIVLVVSGAAAIGAEPATEKELREEVAKLRAKLDQLAQQLEGAAHPINLGRTSLAAVDASSVNGGRDLASPFYGVPNAFDDGQNWVNGINYTYWLGSGEESPFIAVHFDVPVTVTGVFAEAPQGFTARLGFAKGGEAVLEPTAGGLNIKPATGVSWVKLTFRRLEQNKVQEVRVMGHVPPDVKYEVRQPRVVVNQRNAEAMANEAWREWQQRAWEGVGPVTAETKEAFVVTYRRGDLDVCRVTISKATGKAEVTPLAELRGTDGGRPAGKRGP